MADCRRARDRPHGEPRTSRRSPLAERRRADDADHSPCGHQPADGGAMHSVTIAVFEGAEELAFVGAWEVLAACVYLHPGAVPASLVGDTLDPAPCGKGTRVLPQ